MTSGHISVKISDRFVTDRDFTVLGPIGYDENTSRDTTVQGAYIEAEQSAVFCPYNKPH